MLEMTDKQKNIFDEYRNNPHAYPEEHQMSDARLLKHVDELIEEMSWPITFRDDTTADPTFTAEILILLLGRNNLTGFYVQLKVLSYLRFLNVLSQEEIRGFTGLSTATYNRYKKALIRIGLIGEVRQGHTKLVQFYPVTRLPYIIRPKDPKDYAKWYKGLKQKIEILTPDKLVQLQLIEQKEQFQLHIEGIVDEKVKEKEEKRVEAKKKEEKKFPNEDYEIVLSAFRKYKRVGLIGPEVIRAKHAIKQMFLAQRTPKQITECIQFFAEHQGEEDYRWLSSWTLETVMKKMPEFLAGQLRSHRIGDDIRTI